MTRQYRQLNRHRRHRMFIINDSGTLRLSPALAQEIGLIESMVLLQIEFLISISEHEREGRTWTYQSSRDLTDKYFPFLGKSTVHRALKSLKDQGYLICGNFNRAAFDRTSWWALNEEKLAELEAIRFEDSPRR